MKNVALIALGLLATFLSAAKARDAGQILDASGVKGGLVVVIGCDNPALLAQLRPGNSHLVHGLDRDSAKVADARRYLQEKGLYGPVTVARWKGSQLPYVDGLVNMIVVTGDTGPISRDEMIRVLAAGGVVADARNEKIEITRKPWPVELDEWTHDRHDASNHAVSSDTVVGPPRGLRWTCGPAYAVSHEHFAGVSAMVTAGGRVFYIIDEGPISSVYLPLRWKLVARDAFSGVLLWKRPITNWESRLRGFRSGPPEIGRRIVATGDRVYVSLGYGEPVTVLDAPTGKQLATLAGTDGARELALAGDVLYVLADDMTADEHRQRNAEIDRVWPTLEIWYRFPRKPLPMYGTQRIVAIRTRSGELLWKRQFKAPGEVMPTTMAVDDARVCVQTVSHLVCLDASDGKELWRSERPVARSRLSWSTPTLVIHDGVVLSVDRTASDNADQSPPARGSKWIISSGGFEQRQPAELVTFSLDDGKELWRAPYSENYNVPTDIFVIDGVVWVGNLRAGSDPGFTEGRDLKSGKVTATIPAQKAWGHHRCYRNKATVRWLMVGRGGIQFIDPRSGSVNGNSWVRGTCQYGTMPANGLIYAPQHSCACQPEELLTGMNALAPRSSAGEGPPPLEKGPAYDEIANLRPGSSQTAWPTYRCDGRRSGYQDLPAPREPGVAWTRRLKTPITAPVTADGIVVVAETDRHALHALSTTDGRPAWTFVADGRIDSPPTLSGGLCLFGTRGGFVYCLRASDGALVWRFRAAPQDRRLFAYEQLESVWPVHGSVLVDDKPSGGVVYFAAGRSARVDGGIRLYALDVTTGEVLHKADVNMMAGAQGARIIRQSVLPDVLSVEKNTIWMRGLGVDKNLAPVEDLPHLFAPSGLLDDTWWHRTYWIYGTAIGGGYTHWPLVGNVVPAGRLLALDGGPLIYGYGRMAYQAGKGHVRADMAADYRLFGEVLQPKPATANRKRRIQWATPLPFVARSIVLTRDALLIAGGKSPIETAERHSPGTFWIASREDGSKRTACELPAPPVLDGMALTDAGVFISTIDGSVVCLRANRDE
ncbi:MAG: PQQ-binding-like beta-propeller repeat protein [Candidatus Nealsonbacteria bacterium]|nr:PQQ-binding-like beta-propeller repeat protein [Candidatus Nealsonbacteria bacterium]